MFKPTALAQALFDLRHKPEPFMYEMRALVLAGHPIPVLCFRWPDGGRS